MQNEWLIQKERNSVKRTSWEEVIASRLLSWYEVQRRELPWRKDGNPYHIWLSEIMLQQTRVEAVKEYYYRFLNRLPSIQDLAGVEDDVLMKLWQGLGYYNRARNLKKAAQILVTEYQGEFPEKYEEILQLPGIGAYTAGAIASIAFGENVPAIDGNVYRIYTRLTADGRDITKGKVQRDIYAQLKSLVPKDASGEYNQAWMDLGATICIPNGEPKCKECPLADVCMAKKTQTMSMYPNKPSKKPRKIEERTIFLLEYQGKYLLQKRPNKGLLAGLWEFPGVEGYLMMEELLEHIKSQEIVVGEIELLGKHKHIFSHIEWHMLGYLLHIKECSEEISERQVFAEIEELEGRYSIPSAFRAFLSGIFTSDRKSDEKA